MENHEQVVDNFRTMLKNTSFKDKEEQVDKFSQIQVMLFAIDVIARGMFVVEDDVQDQGIRLEDLESDVAEHKIDIQAHWTI